MRSSYLLRHNQAAGKPAGRALAHTLGYAQRGEARALEDLEDDPLPRLC